MVLKREVKEEGCFKMGIGNNEWNFHLWRGDSYRVANKNNVPRDIDLDYKVTGTILKGDIREIRIAKVSKIFKD